MRLATLNINSIRARAPRAIALLERENLDVLALQETKCKNDQFPVEPFAEAGYEVAMTGVNQWNGVAVISRLPIVDVQVGFPGQPVWVGNRTVEARAIGVTVEPEDGGPVTVWSLYIPNGRELDDPHYDYKLDFLAALATYAANTLESDPNVKMAFVGDWNVAPLDEDVWDMDFFEGKTHVSGPERAGIAAIEDSGFKEVTRDLVDNYTYWDYQRLRFPKNEGMRIDFIFASPALAKTVVSAQIDRDERKGKGASDHVPVIAQFD